MSTCRCILLNGWQESRGVVVEEKDQAPGVCLPSLNIVSQKLSSEGTLVVIVLFESKRLLQPCVTSDGTCSLSELLC